MVQVGQSGFSGRRDKSVPAGSRAGVHCPGPGHSAGEGARNDFGDRSHFAIPIFPVSHESIASAGPARASDVQAAVSRTVAAFKVGAERLRMEADYAGMDSVGEGSAMFSMRA